METEPNLNFFRPLLQERFKTVVVGDAKNFASLTRRHRKVKTLRKQGAVVILTLLLAISAYAGQIQAPGVASGTSTSTSTGTTLLEDATTTVIVTIISVIP
jgi:hypothetical protein